MDKKEQLLSKTTWTAQDICNYYDIPQRLAYQLLNRRGCPRLSGGKNKKYWVLREEFLRFMLMQKVK